MNTIHKQFIGAGIGAAIGLFIAQVIVDYIQMLEEPIPPWIDGTENDPTDHPEDDIKGTFPQRPNEMAKKSNTKNYTQYFLQSERPDLAALVAKYNSEDEIGDDTRSITDADEDELVEEVEFEKIEDQDDDSDDPKIISMNEYANDDEFAHVTLQYFSDDVVTDGKNHPIDRPEKFLGDDALVSFGELSEDEDIVYVRNIAKRCMYEVVRVNHPFVQIRNSRVQQHVAEKRAKKEEEDDRENHT